MRLSHRSIIAAWLGLALAGCIGAGDPLQVGVVDGNDSTFVVESVAVNLTELAAAGLPVPEWRVGDAWTVEQYGPSGDSSCQLVVTAADSNYMLRPTCETLAQADAAFDMSYVGPIGRDHLSGAQQGTPVRFFDFPLTDGKTWTTKWDGIDVTLTATFVASLAAPGAGSAPGFAIVGTTADGETYVTYDYAPALKWWTAIDFAEGYGTRVTKFEEGWTGTYKTATTNLAYESPGNGLLVPATFGVSEGQTSLLLILSGRLGGHSFAVNLVDPDGTTQYQRVENAGEGGFFEVVTLPAIPGDWKLASVGAYDPNAGSLRLAIHEVLVTDETLA